MTAPPKYRSFEALSIDGNTPRVSADRQRLRWASFGPLETSIFVAPPAPPPTTITFATGIDSPPPFPPSVSTAASAAGEEPYYRPHPSAAIHAVSASPLTEPPVAFLIVGQADLAGREARWVGAHMAHAGAEWAPGGIGGCGDLPDDDNYDDDDDDDEIVHHDDDGDRQQQQQQKQQQKQQRRRRRIVRCCGQDRPVVPRPLIVRASSSSSSSSASAAAEPYVTVHDYVMAVHPWLQRHRDGILEARRVLALAPAFSGGGGGGGGGGGRGSAPASTGRDAAPLYVHPLSLDVVTLVAGTTTTTTTTTTTSTTTTTTTTPPPSGAAGFLRGGLAARVRRRLV